MRVTHFLLGSYLSYRERRYLRQLRPAHLYTDVREENVLGRTVIATENIRPGTLLGVYPGVNRSLREFYEKHPFAEKSMRYAYRLSEEIVIDPSDLFGSVPNHPNLRLALVNEPPPGHRINVLPISTQRYIWFLAIREIQSGEQLFTTYGASFKRHYPSEIAESESIPEMTADELAVLHAAKCRYPWLKNWIEVVRLGTSPLPTS